MGWFGRSRNNGELHPPFVCRIFQRKNPEGEEGLLVHLPARRGRKSDSGDREVTNKGDSSEVCKKGLGSQDADRAATAGQRLCIVVRVVHLRRASAPLLLTFIYLCFSAFLLSFFSISFLFYSASSVWPYVAQYAKYAGSRLAAKRTVVERVPVTRPGPLPVTKKNEKPDCPLDQKPYRTAARAIILVKCPLCMSQ